MKKFTSKNPATGKVVWKGSAASYFKIDKTISTARQALEAWSSQPFEERLRIIEQFRDLLQKHKSFLSDMISLETGKPFWESREEVQAMIGKIAISTQAYRERTPENSLISTNTNTVTRHKPHGVVAVFGPFNFPGHLPNGHIIPALLAGNTVVFKPSELTPLVAEKTIELWRQTALPASVLQLIQGEAETGKALAQHPHIDGLFFTGSSQTGLLLSEYFGKHPEKILALEMGGNNPLIIDNPSQIQQVQAAAYFTILSAYITTGQRCTCARRLIVPTGKSGDLFLDALVEMTQTIQVGPCTMQPEPFMGPIISEESAQKVLQVQEKLLKAGAQSLLEMQKIDHNLLSPGLIDVSAVPDRADEEVFGPLLQVIRVDSFEEAITEANNTRYGLSAGILTDDEARYREFFRRSRAGIVNWNAPTTGASSAAPFGGVGLSGNHRPSAYYAADYCSYPVTSIENTTLEMPERKKF